MRVLLEQIWALAMPSSEFQGLLELDSTALCLLWVYINWSQSGEELMSKEVVDMFEFTRQRVGVEDISKEKL